MIAEPRTDCILGKICYGTQVGFRAQMQKGLNKQPSQRPQELWVHPLPDPPEETRGGVLSHPSSMLKTILLRSQIVLNEEAGRGRPACDSHFGMAPRPSVCVLKPGEHAPPEPLVFCRAGRRDQEPQHDKRMQSSVETFPWKRPGKPFLPSP